MSERDVVRMTAPDDDAIDAIRERCAECPSDDVITLLAALDAALAEVERLRVKLTAMHRRAQRAEGIADRYAEGRPQGAHGRSIGRALANYAAHRAIQQRDEAIAERDAARAEAQRERERADALQRCLGQRAPDEPETYA